MYSSGTVHTISLNLHTNQFKVKYNEKIMNTFVNDKGIKIKLFSFSQWEILVFSTC